MKKLLLLFFSILLSFNSYADEQVNLTCAFYETFHWDTLKTTDTKPEDVSLIVYPQIEMYIHRGVTGYYESVGNQIKFSLYSGDENRTAKYDYSLDRTTSVFEYDFSIKSPESGKYERGLTHKGKCKKTENLF
jgi:hypothetical protein